MSMPVKCHFISRNIRNINKYKEKFKSWIHSLNAAKPWGLIFPPMTMNIWSTQNCNWSITQWTTNHLIRWNTVSCVILVDGFSAKSIKIITPPHLSHELLFWYWTFKIIGIHWINMKYRLWNMEKNIEIIVINCISNPAFKFGVEKLGQLCLRQKIKMVFSSDVMWISFTLRRCREKSFTSVIKPYRKSTIPV